jgi:hypothetical protein
MIVCGVPIAAREIHHLLRGWLKMAQLRTDPDATGARLNFLYFSYAPDSPYLELSLRTLTGAIPAELLGRVIVAEDQKAPFNPEQLGRLHSVFADLDIRPIHDFQWGSPRSTHAELQLFKQIAAELAHPKDLLVKVDSDVLMLPNDKWRRVLYSNAPAIGDGHYLRFEYAQGGLYMIRKACIEGTLAPVTLRTVEDVAQAIDSVGEDMAISELLRRADQPFFLTRMMLFPEEYRPLSALNPLVRQEFMALHCHKDKTNMEYLCTKFGLLPGANAP